MESLPPPILHQIALLLPSLASLRALLLTSRTLHASLSHPHLLRDFLRAHYRPAALHALLYAAIESHDDAKLQHLVTTAHIPAHAGDSHFPLRRAAALNRPGTIALLLTFPPYSPKHPGASPHAAVSVALAIAAEAGGREAVGVLLRAGADVHYGGDAALRMACVKGHEGVVRMLLAAGAEAGAENWAGLRVARKRGWGGIERMLLGQGGLDAW
mmetsp:Transcript_25564/g.63838  ORF Transcript_25564/g.63838 Transcript_25564/m.63838 type:complete len:214 (-) Transcript_25564:1943-2584(-)